MSRRRHLIAYDIADDRRLRRIAKIMEGYGVRLQYSVFLCDLSTMELARWETDIRRELVMSKDSVVCIDIGAMDNDLIQVIGTPRRLPHSGPMIF